MTNRKVPPTMDVLPFPDGYGFQGAQEWWDSLRGQKERQRLDKLVGLALLDEGMCRRLVADRDPALMNAFGLSAETQSWLRSIQANNLTEFAQAVMAGPEGHYLEEAS